MPERRCDRFNIHKLQGQKYERANSQSAPTLSAVMAKFHVGGPLQHVKALNISKPLGEISTPRNLAEKSYDKKIVEDLSETCVTHQVIFALILNHFLV